MSLKRRSSWRAPFFPAKSNTSCGLILGFSTWGESSDDRVRKEGDEPTRLELQERSGKKELFIFRIKEGGHVPRPRLQPHQERIIERLGLYPTID